MNCETSSVEDQAATLPSLHRLVGRAKRKTSLSLTVSRLLPDGTDVILDLEPSGPVIAPGELFGAKGPLTVEIGPGGGEFLLAMAAANPGRNFLAVEYKRIRLEKIARRIVRAGLTNVRVVWADAREFVERFLPPASIDGFVVNFPDPWSKRRHRRRRLLQGPFLAQVARVLVRGGTLTVGTDVIDYARQVMGALESSGEWENVHGRAVLVDRIEDQVTTLFESRFRKQGVSVHFLRYRKH